MSPVRNDRQGSVLAAEVCPTCGRGRLMWDARIVGSHAKRGRAMIRRPGGQSVRLGRGAKVVRGVYGAQIVVCADEFHDATGFPERRQQSVERAVLPARVHHPDLRKMKASVRRAMQGKARR